MIEVEKKRIPNDDIINAIKKKATRIKNLVLEDKCLDFQDLRLIKNDIWLRCRNGRYELKKPLHKERKWGDVYEEIENEQSILKELGIDSFSASPLITLTHLVTEREEFVFAPFNIAIDNVTCPYNSFKYKLMEIELLVESVEECADAEKKIKTFMNAHSIADKDRADSKFIAFVKENRPDIYSVLSNVVKS